MSHTGTSQTWLCTQMPWDLVKVQMLIQEAPGGLGSAFLTRSQGMPMLLVYGPHSEKHRPICPPQGRTKECHFDGQSFQLIKGIPLGLGAPQDRGPVCCSLIDSSWCPSQSSAHSAAHTLRTGRDTNGYCIPTMCQALPCDHHSHN